eukprot:NODE_1569_length_1124_cov_56.691163_g1278_i0.p1 GENE.NODE_1569_length_1124_cov_56.691163_g1278_i0~~NODE_1569_length_1124_cov_56.691163_g1278_i0.p1  ORF type:complete len:285 (-),score=99.42 NODE_1569_length_1124_cov_56.691163_g1278_i0:212-1066(-)
MVVLAAAVLTKPGKALLSRQFVEMSRIRIEGLLSAFPKLMGSGKQYTYFETDTVRYVYQPIESLFLVLITNRSSNIVEDLETLRLLGRLVPEYCERLEEEDITDKAFELLFAFDEVIQMGYRENLSLEQVKTFLEMESHEEKHANALKDLKVADAKVQANKMATQFAKEKKSFGNSLTSKDFSLDMKLTGDTKIPTVVEEERPKETAADRKRGSSTGWSMKKGGKEENHPLLSKMVKSGELDAAPSRGAAAAPVPTHTANLTLESVHMKIDEKINAVILLPGYE